MSRIQDILSKAERDGTVRRTRPLSDEYGSRPADEAMSRSRIRRHGTGAASGPDEARSPTHPIECPTRRRAHADAARRPRIAGRAGSTVRRRQPPPSAGRAALPVRGAGRPARRRHRGRWRARSRCSSRRWRRTRSPRSSTDRCARASSAPKAPRNCARSSITSPQQGRRQEPHRRQPRADDGAGVPAAGAARRRRPAPARRCTRCSASPTGPGWRTC